MIYAYKTQDIASCKTLSDLENNANLIEILIIDDMRFQTMCYVRPAVSDQPAQKYGHRLESNSQPLDLQSDTYLQPDKLTTGQRGPVFSDKYYVNLSSENPLFL